METTKSLEIIESMLRESKKSLYRNSFYFLLWGILLIPISVLEYFVGNNPNFWIVWPSIGIIGGIASFFYGKKEAQSAGISTAGDRIIGYTWAAFGFSLVYVIAYAVSRELHPQSLILVCAAAATFISGGISKFKPFVWGGFALFIGAVLCGFIVAPQFHSLIFAGSILLGYIIPGFILRKAENGNA